MEFIQSLLSGERCDDEKSSINIFPVRACMAPVVLTRP